MTDRDPVLENVVKACQESAYANSTIMEEMYLDARDRVEDSASIDVVLLLLTPDQVDKHWEECVDGAMDLLINALEDLT